MRPSKSSLGLFRPPRRVRVRQLLLAFLCCPLLLFLLYTCALFFTHQCMMFRSNFKGLDQFKWPPFVDVRAEVERQLLGEKPESIVVNDWSTFKTVIEPNCSGWTLLTAAGQWPEDNNEKEVLILVKSAPDRIAQRNAIRATFGAYKSLGGYRLRFIFVMGSLLNWRLDWMARMRAEANRWGDLLVGQHQDDYFHSSRKFASAIRLARNFCGRSSAVSFTLLLDDDYVMFPWELVKQLEEYSPTEAIYAGFCYFNVGPYRGTNEKWAVTKREYPFDEYPPYCTGGSVLLSQWTVEQFYLAIQHVQFFVWEDVYIGMLAHFLHIQPLVNEKFWGRPYSDDPPQLYCRLRNSPLCKNWRGVITAHGYGPEEIRRLYAKVKAQWQLETEAGGEQQNNNESKQHQQQQNLTMRNF